MAPPLLYPIILGETKKARTKRLSHRRVTRWRKINKIKKAKKAKAETDPCPDSTKYTEKAQTQSEAGHVSESASLGSEVPGECIVDDGNPGPSRTPQEDDCTFQSPLNSLNDQLLLADCDSGSMLSPLYQLKKPWPNEDHSLPTSRPFVSYASDCPLIGFGVSASPIVHPYCPMPRYPPPTIPAISMSVEELTDRFLDQCNFNDKLYQKQASHIQLLTEELECLKRLLRC